MKKSTILFSLFLLGCAGPREDYNIFISDQFPPEKVDQVQLALDAWQAAAKQFGLHFNVFFGSAEHSHGTYSIYPSSFIDLEKKYGTGTSGDTSWYDYCQCGGEVLLADFPNDERLSRITISHEIGHALGIPHSPNVGDLMYWTYLQNPTDIRQGKISCWDIQQFAAVRNEKIVFCDEEISVLPEGMQ